MGTGEEAVRRLRWGCAAPVALLAGVAIGAVTWVVPWWIALLLFVLLVPWWAYLTSRIVRERS
jgi:hypothetical protein